METNFEHYKDELLKCYLIHNSKCKFIKKHNIITDCVMTSCKLCAENFQKWLDEEYKEPIIEIDWTKVPADTPVYVWDDPDGRKMIKHFASYDPNNKKGHFLCYIQGKTSWTTAETTHWVYCELAREEDKVKYAKGDDK